MLKAQELKGNLEYALRAASQQSHRPVLHGVYFDVNKGLLVGCDGYRLHITTIDTLPIDNFIVNYADCKKLVNKIKKTGSPVSVTWENDKVIFSQRYKGKEETYTFTPVWGNYPDYEVIMPKQEGKEITLSYDTTHMVNTVFGNLCSVTLSGNKAYARQNLPYPVTMDIPEDIQPEITVNPEYLFDAALDGGFLTLYVTEPTAPFLFKSGSFNGIIMPMSVKNQKQ